MNSKILHAAMYCLSPEGFWGLPIIGEGEPGTGKTSFMKAEVERYHGLPFKRLSPAENGEGAFGVVPVPGEDGFLKYPPPDWIQPFKAAGGGVVFLDEINTAPPALQAPLLGLVQLRTLGSYVFPKRTRVVGAMNAVADAAGGWDLSPALANRFGHFTFEALSEADWVVALLSGFSADGDGETLNAEQEEKRVLEAWPAAMAWAAGMVGGFIQRNPAKLHARPAKTSSAASRAWPSRRTVHYAAVALASSRIHALSETDTDTFMGGFVGNAWVQEYATWRAHADLPDPNEVLEGKVNFKHDSRRLDRSMATLGACAALCVHEKTNGKLTKPRGNKMWEVLSTVLKDAADCAIPAARALIQKGIINPMYPAAEDPCSRLYPLLTASGLLGSKAA